MDWKLVALGTVVAITVGFMASRAHGEKGAREAVAAGARLVDVRSPQEYAAGHLPDAINIPLGDLRARMKELGAKDRTLVVYCRSGARSSRAKDELLAAGYQTVINLGAMSNW